MDYYLMPLYVAPFEFRYDKRFNPDIFDKRMLMWKRINRAVSSEIGVGFFCAGLFWLAVFGWTFSYFPTTAEKEACYQSAEKSGRDTRECESFWEKTTSDPIAFFTLVLAFSTIGMWTATITLAQTNKAQISLAQQEFNATHRPRIRIHAAEFKRIPAPPSDDKTDISDRLGVSLICFNFGDAAAVKIEVRGQIFAGANFALDVERPLVKTIDNVVSGGKFRAEIISDVPITTVAAAKRSGFDYHCVGWIAYWDGSGVRRESGFCYCADVFAQPRERWTRVADQEHEYEY